MSHQDWSPVTISNSKPKTASVPKISQTGSALKKLEEAEVAKVKMLTPASRSEIAQVRVVKGLTQKQLDMAGAFPSNSCNAWEAGRICPTSQQIQKLQRILGIKLEIA
jgi:ribosome-binding protein aMBF1 (putative translation factor)